jgi:hypothetical protein
MKRLEPDILIEITDEDANLLRLVLGKVKACMKEGSKYWTDEDPLELTLDEEQMDNLSSILMTLEHL